MYCPLASVPLGATSHVPNLVVCVIVQFQKGFARRKSSWLVLTLPSINIESTLSGQPESKLLERQW